MPSWRKDRLPLVGSTDTIRKAMAAINESYIGIALVVDKRRCLLGTVTDGDIRRSILSNGNLDEAVGALLGRKADVRYARPVTASCESSTTDMLNTMLSNDVIQLPLVDAEGVVVDLVTLKDLLPEEEIPLQAVIMAGGMGSRLRPLTEDVPKPMLPVGDRPLMEHTIERLKEAGIRRVNVSTHYLADKIKEHFGNGESFGVSLDYISEDRPLGTAGALSLMQAYDGPLLVINGDIMTQLDFRALAQYHRDNKAMLTVAVRKYDLSVPYGVIESEGPIVRAIEEKPVLRFFVNAGIYLMEPAARQYVPADTRFDMTDLIRVLLKDGQRVVSFPVHEYWLDIGQIEDYEKAKRDATARRQTP